MTIKNHEEAPMAIDRGRAGDAMGIGAVLMDGGRETGSIKIQKFDDDQSHWVTRKLFGHLGAVKLEDVPGLELPWERFRQFGVEPSEVYEKDDCNLITKAGWDHCLLAANWNGGTHTTQFSATVGRIGIGTSATAPTYADTALNSVTSLTGTGNWVLCGAAPVITDTSAPATVAFTSSFTSAYGTGAAWNEFAVDAGTATAVSNTVTATADMVNHGLATPGTKGASTTWTVTVTLSFT
jgi:hypothetical protein